MWLLVGQGRLVTRCRPRAISSRWMRGLPYVRSTSQCKRRTSPVTKAVPDSKFARTDASVIPAANGHSSFRRADDEQHPAPSPSVWRMRNMTGAAIVLGLSKLLFSTSLLALGRFGLQLDAAALQTLAFITLVFGNQALLFVLRERRHLWSSLPSAWVLASSAADVAIVSTLALSGILMEPLSLGIVAGVFAAAVGLALILDQMRGPVMAGFKVR